MKVQGCFLIFFLFIYQVRDVEWENEQLLDEGLTWWSFVWRENCWVENIIEFTWVIEGFADSEIHWVLVFITTTSVASVDDYSFDSLKVDAAYEIPQILLRSPNILIHFSTHLKVNRFKL